MSSHETQQLHAPAPDSEQIDVALDAEYEAYEPYQPKHAAAEDGEPFDDGRSAEDRESFAEDERNRYEAKELLHGSRAVVAAITEQGGKSARGTLRVWAAVRNTSASPRRGFHNFLVNRAEHKVTKRARKLERADDGLYRDEVQASLAKAQEKLISRRDKQGDVKANVSSNIENAQKARSNEHQEFVNKLLDKKGAALVRKEARHRLQEQGAGFLKRRRLAKQIVGSEAAKSAISLAVVSRENRINHKVFKKNLNRRGKLVEHSRTKMDRASEKYGSASDSLDGVMTDINRLRELTPAAREEMQDAKAELDTFDEDDLGRLGAEERYNAAAKSYARYEARLNDKKLQKRGLEDQLRKQLDLYDKHKATSETRAESYGKAQDIEQRVRGRRREVTDAADAALSDLLNPAKTPENQQSNETEE